MISLVGQKKEDAVTYLIENGMDFCVSHTKDRRQEKSDTVIVIREKVVGGVVHLLTADFLLNI